jgi:ABC-type uncharacterized transport system substrate-binding protein
MMISDNKRKLLKCALGGAALSLQGANSKLAFSGTVDAVSTALLDIRVPSANIRFQRELENESFIAFPPNRKLNIINIPFGIQADRQKLQSTLLESRFFACVSVGEPATIAAAEILDSTSIVFSVSSDPSRSLVKLPSTGMPKNLTGFTSFSPTHAKRWEVLRSAFPRIDKIIVLAEGRWLREQQLAYEANKHSGRMGKIDVIEIDVKRDVVVQISKILSLAGRHVGIDFPHSGLANKDPYSIIDCINSSHVPCVYDGTHYVNWGGLLSYEADPLPEAKTTIECLVLLMQGIPPEKIPIRYPTSFTLAVNLETAKNANLPLNKSLLLRANHFVKKTNRAVVVS